jgi:hypothetical protein
MGLFIKTIVAFLIGAGTLMLAQHLWASSIMSQVRTQSAAMPVATTPYKSSFNSIDADKLRLTITPKIDPNVIKNGERLGVMSAQRRIDMQIRNAQSYVPAPRSIPGTRR